MTINDKKADVLNIITLGNDGTIRIPLFDKAETLLLDFGKDCPVGSDCYCYDPEKITFNLNAKGKKIPFTADYKSGKTFKGTLQRVAFNDPEQKAYDAKLKKKKAYDELCSTITKREAEQKRKEAQTDAAEKAVIRMGKREAGEPEGQGNESYNTRKYVYESWEQLKKSKHGVGFKSLASHGMGIVPLTP